MKANISLFSESFITISQIAKKVEKTMRLKIKSKF